jgi:putative DNA primase/helicase
VGVVVTDGIITPITKTVNASVGADMSGDAADPTVSDVTPSPAAAGVAALLATEPEPWDEQVDGADLLDEIEALFARYVVMPSEAGPAVALWVLSSWTLDAFDVAPILAVLSPVKRCGKTTLLTLLRLLSRRAVSASNITPAAIFRIVDKYQPTLIFDEADTWLRQRTETRGIINSGHFRPGAYVIRTSGPDHSPQSFSTFGPKVIAAIGSLPTTIRDRSIVILLSRMSTAQEVEHLPPSRVSVEAEPLRRRARRWADDHDHALRAAEPERVKDIDDRAQDNWGPLVIIADACGGKWPQRARLAAVALSVTDDEQELGVMLLEDLPEIFAVQESAVLYTDVLLANLHALEERPWSEVRNGKPMTARGLAMLLKPFGVMPSNVDGKRRGYRADDVEAAASRYVG